MELADIKNRLQRAASDLLETKRKSEKRADFAARHGIGDGTFGRLMRGEGNPTLETMAALVQARKISLRTLLFPAETFVQEEPPRYLPTDQQELADAIRISDEIIAAAGIASIEPDVRAALIIALQGLQQDGGNIESARRLIAKLIAATSKGGKDESSRQPTTSARTRRV